MMRRTVTVAALVASAMASVLSPASAHTENDYYPFEYPSNTSEHWVFDNNVPADFRDDITYGIGRWDNGAGGNGPNFIYDGVITTTNDFDPCTGARSKVFAREDLGAALGQGNESILGFTPSCYQGNTIVRFSMTFERTADGGSATGWYTGSGSAPGTRWDLRSIAAHESGHATGFLGHFTAPPTCPSPLSPPIYETMCTGSDALRGTTVLRSLETHDLHTYAGAY